MLERFRKWHIYVFLAIELLGAFIVAIYVCVNGPSSATNLVAYFMLILSFVGIGLLFSKNQHASNTNVIDLFGSIVHISINHYSLGLIFGWIGCPYI